MNMNAILIDAMYRHNAEWRALSRVGKLRYLLSYPTQSLTGVAIKTVAVCMLPITITVAFLLVAVKQSWTIAQAFVLNK